MDPRRKAAEVQLLRDALESVHLADDPPADRRRTA
jgi:hypothetical protein